MRIEKCYLLTFLYTISVLCILFLLLWPLEKITEIICILVSLHLLLKLNATIQLLFLDQEHLSLIHLKETKMKKTNGSTP